MAALKRKFFFMILIVLMVNVVMIYNVTLIPKLMVRADG